MTGCLKDCASCIASMARDFFWFFPFVFFSLVGFDGYLPTRASKQANLDQVTELDGFMTWQWSFCKKRRSDRKARLGDVMIRIMNDDQMYLSLCGFILRAFSFASRC